MGTRFEALEPAHQKFIEKQPVFFVGSAAREGRINVSPKGMDSLRVLGPNRILWRNMTGSGNETATHLEDNARMTLMWCAFSGPPMILRAYGTARAIHRLDPEWATFDAEFSPDPAARQLFDLTIDLVQKSCGYAVPEMSYNKDRDVLKNWAKDKGQDGIRDYWRNRNTETLDGVPTQIIEKNIGP
ncbi:MAG: pyridoxamine 5'-phosphate oxidase family protein [Pseudomonadota bacterium]